MDVILLQLALWEYQSEFEHPIIDILKGSVGSFVGEDIELFNRLLAQHSRHDSRRGQAEQLDVAYRTLGLMVHNGINFNAELLECGKFLKGNRRYIITDDSEAVQKTRQFLSNLYLEFANEQFQHYYLRREPHKRSVSGRRVTIPINKADYKTMTFRSSRTSVANEEVPRRELVDVQYLATVNWEDILSEKFDGLLTRTWRFKELLKEKTLERFEKNFRHYKGEDEPQRRQERKECLASKKRKARTQT